MNYKLVSSPPFRIDFPALSTQLSELQSQSFSTEGGTTFQIRVSKAEFWPPFSVFGIELEATSLDSQSIGTIKIYGRSEYWDPTGTIQYSTPRPEIELIKVTILNPDYRRKGLEVPW